MKLIYKQYYKPVALTWMGCVVVFMVAYILVLLPQSKEKQSLQRQLFEKEQMYDFALTASREETRLKLNEQIEELRDRLRDFVSNPEDAANLTFDISHLASESGITSFSVTTANEHKKPEVFDSKHLFEKHIDVSFTGSFNQFAALLNTMERNQPVILVDGFKITRSKQGDTSHRASMKLVALVRQRPGG